VCEAEQDPEQSSLRRAFMYEGVLLPAWVGLSRSSEKTEQSKTGKHRSLSPQANLCLVPHQSKNEHSFKNRGNPATCVESVGLNRPGRMSAISHATQVEQGGECLEMTTTYRVRQIPRDMPDCPNRSGFFLCFCEPAFSYPWFNRVGRFYVTPLVWLGRNYYNFWTGISIT
jgi:hypothetical protein